MSAFSIDFTKPMPKLPATLGYREQRLNAVAKAQSTKPHTDPKPVPDSGYSSEFIKAKMTELTEKLYEKKESLLTGSSILTSYENNNATSLEPDLIDQAYMSCKNNNFKLPIAQRKKEILDSISNQPVTIINGGTGCGKTTQVPQYVLDDCFERHAPCNIIVTQPRRLAAISIAKRVCSERDWPEGTICGHRVGHDQLCSTDTRLVYCTTGYLLENILHRCNFSDYTHVFLDEVHERSQEMDLLLLIIRLLIQQSSIKVILMSATMDNTMYSEYFKFNMPIEISIIKIESKSPFFVKEHFLDDLPQFRKSLSQFYLCRKPCITETATEACLRIIKVVEKETKTPKSAILIFLPGILEIRDLFQLLKNQEKKDWLIFQLHSSIPKEDQARAMNIYKPTLRKIILSTNIAESSITVPDVEVVIDFCLTKSLISDVETGYSALQAHWISRYEGIQRGGRVGRVTPGRVYRLVPRDFYESFDEMAKPEMSLVPLETTVLRTKSLNLSDPVSILSQALSQPPKYKIHKAILRLKEAGALTTTMNGTYSEDDGHMTFLGHLMSHLPVDYRNAKLVALGYACGIPEDAIIVAAYLTLDRLFLIPDGHELSAYETIRQWANNTNSDAFAALNAYKVYQSKITGADFTRGDSFCDKDWAKNCFLQLRALKEMDILVKDMLRRLKKVTMDVDTVQYPDCDESVRCVLLKFILAGAYYGNYYVTANAQSEEDILRTLNHRNPLQTVYFRNFPRNENGQIYVKEIKKYFQNITRNKQPYISFDNERVFVEFASSEKRWENTIVPELYLSLFQHRRKNHLTLSFLGKQRSEDIAEKFALVNNRCKLFFNDVDEPQDGEHRREITNLPDVVTTVITFRIVKAFNLAYFIASYADWDESRIRNFEVDWSQLEHKPLTGYPGIGCVYLVHHSNGKCVRARVEQIKNTEEVKVLYIDLGDSHWIQTQQLLIPNAQCVQDVYNTPAFTFECRLANIGPGINNDGHREYTVMAQKDFNSVVHSADSVLSGDVYSVVEGVVALEMFTVKDGARISVNKWLVTNKHAEIVPEGYLSESNHNVRLKTDQDQQFLQVYSQKQRMSLRLPEPEYPNLSGEPTLKQVTLTGPSSPLRSTLLPLNDKKLMNINVSPNSVNCVILNAWPSNYRDVLLVAHGLTNLTGSNNVCLMNTTLLPDVRGLTSLVPVLFAPCVKLRTDMFNTRYTSALCGMGSKEDGSAIYPENDFNVVFDAEFSKGDLNLVNQMREALSYILYTDGDYRSNYPNYSRSEYLEAITKVRNCFTRLLSTRKRREKYFPDQRTRMNWDNIGYPKEPRRLYPQHKTLNLDSSEALQDKMSKLYSMITGEEPFKSTCCPTCLGWYSTISELHIHVSGPEHKNRENHLCS